MIESELRPSRQPRGGSVLRRTPARWALVLPALGLLCLAVGAQGVGDTIDEARATLEKWVEARKTISKEKRDWELGRATLEERMELVRKEIDGLAKRLEEARASIADADKKRAELLEENERKKQASQSLVATIATQEARTKELLARLPDPIRERVKPLTQGIPDNPEETKLSLGQRFQNVVGILNEVNKFNQDIVATSEVRALPDGTSAEVTVLYLGIGQAYYASANGKVAGYGTATDKGWIWAPANEVAPEIARAIRILGNEEVASFVRLPLEIR